MKNSLFKTMAFTAIPALGFVACESDPGIDETAMSLRDRGDLAYRSSTVLQSGYPGQPASGTLFWGAAIGGNADPVERHEIPSGEPLSLRRTFWRWDQRTGSMISTAADDLENGRLPWVSVKPPVCPDGEARCENSDWTGMADGVYDAQIDEMLTALAALPGPVWLTIHHEPEGGGGVNHPDDPVGGSQAHIGMNQRVRDRITALGLENDIALSLILMSWTWDSRSGRNPNDWWEPGIYDILGIDHYNDSEGSLLENGEPTPVFPRIRTWAAQRGVDVAVGEWGMRGEDEAAGQRVLEWYEYAADSHNDGQGARVVGLSAFDSGLNSPTGSWELKGEQLNMFWQLLGDPRTASVNDPSSPPVQHPVAALESGNSLSGNPAANATDDDTGTRWASWNVSGEGWIRFDLGEPREVSSLRLMLYKADTRGPYPLAIEAGNNSGSLTEVWAGDSNLNTGFQDFTFSPVAARYVQVRMTGPHAGEFNQDMLSIWEAQVWGTNP